MLTFNMESVMEKTWCGTSVKVIYVKILSVVLANVSYFIDHLHLYPDIVILFI